MTKARDLSNIPAGGGDLNVDSGTLFVDASENRVGIGTSSPASTVHIDSNASATYIQMENSTNNEGYIGYLSDGSLTFWTDAASRAATIDSSGTLLVGTTSNALTTTGTKLFSSGTSFFVKDNGVISYFNRTTSDGDLIEFRKDNTAVGSIGAEGGHIHIVGAGASSRGLKFVTNLYVRPCQSDGTVSDNNYDLGVSNARFNDAYVANGVTTTSDRNEKQDIEELSEAEQRVAVACKGLLRKFRWKDRVAEKGDDARIHFGIIAQDLQAAFEAEGLDAGRYGMFMYNEWWETYTDVPAVEAVQAQDAVYDEEGNLVSEAVEAVEAKEAYTRTDTYDTEEEAPEGAVKKSRMGVRYSELLAFIIAVI